MELAKNYKHFFFLLKTFNYSPHCAPCAVAVVVVAIFVAVAFVAHGHWIPPAVFTCSKFSKRAQGVSHWQWHERQKERKTDGEAFEA